MHRVYVAVCAFAGLAAPALAQDSGATLILEGKTVQVQLAISPQQVPYVAQMTWRESGKPLFTQDENAFAFSGWLSDTLIGESQPKLAPEWRRRPDRNYDIAEADVYFDNGMRVTWVARLFRGADVLELGLRLNNTRRGSREVTTFPAWRAKWNLDATADLRHWEALSYTPLDVTPSPDLLTLASRLHSSDRVEGEGSCPFWRVRTATDSLFFGLAWSGGWRADIRLQADALDTHVYLPEEEAQLTLDQGGWVEGPILTVTPVHETNPSKARSAWMRQRADIVRVRYNTRPSYPFVYNHWYATRFDVDETFLDAQIAAMDPYKFDAFVVDAGWYAHAGDWAPNVEKFPGDSFARLLGAAREKGPSIGMWSCPQFVPPLAAGGAPATADTPEFYEDFIDAYLRDLNGEDFTALVENHVAGLRERYGISWWKYDQAFFAPDSRAGIMRNVIAFQHAIEAVRLNHPDLFIENCQSGGRMINEFTLRIAQGQWLRDGGATGMEHARANIAVTLSAIDFVPPYQAERWTNNIQTLTQESPEFIRYYARSAMAGTWGISADLPAIAIAHEETLAQEAKNYRRLNLFKEDLRYIITSPVTGGAYAGIEFVRPLGLGVAFLLYRWDATGPFDVNLDVTHIDTRGQYLAEDVDTKARLRFGPGQLAREGLIVHFDANRLSALVFIDPFLPNQPRPRP